MTLQKKRERIKGKPNFFVLESKLSLKNQKL